MPLSLVAADLRLRRLGELKQHFRLLKEIGIGCLIFDKDNCLTLPGEAKVFQPLEEDWKLARSTFRTAILSNTSTNSAEELEESLGSPVIKHWARKPFCFLAVRRFLSARGEDSSKVAIVGDRVLTDVLFGRLNGFYTILVDPIDPTSSSLRRADDYLFSARCRRERRE